MVTYDELAERLAPDLAFLKILDFINLRAQGGYVQVIQDPDSLTAELMVNRPITDDERRWLIESGWQPPHPGQPTWLRVAAWPPTSATARELSFAMVNALRYFTSADISDIQYDARNYDTWEPIEPRSLSTLRRAPDRRPGGGAGNG